MGKSKLKILIEKNLAHSGFVKQPYAKFENFFLDSIISQNDNLYRDLRLTANLSRQEMADLVGLTYQTIRNYESNQRGIRVPKWYYIMLRLVNGDLSFYGKRWNNTRIQHHDRKLKTTYSAKAIEPTEMNAMYNRVALDARREASRERDKSAELQRRIEALESELELSRLHNETLSSRLSELEARKSLKEKGKLIQLFSN